MPVSVLVSAGARKKIYGMYVVGLCEFPAAENW